VVITNVETGVKRTVVSDDAGFYNATNVHVGNYTVSVTMPGFKTATSDATKIDIRSNRVVNITLQVGDVAEQVTVEGASPAQVELRSGEVSNLITGEQVTELPLNGRSFVQLSLLVPGASQGQGANVRYTGLFAGVDISFSGSSSNSNMWLVDGSNNVDMGSGRTILTYPSVDSIAEFKIQRNSYSADMGASSGAQINVVTKSGTNEFHGSVYEFHRNNVLNATNFFLNRARGECEAAGGKDCPKKQALINNNFGYTVGGPILKDKAFFFWSQEWRKEGRGVPRQRLVPTALEQQYDFSGPNSRDYPDPVDWISGEPFPNNKIPADRMSPFGKAWLKLYPAPTIAPSGGKVPGYNWVAAPKAPINTRQEQIRGDYNITEKHSVMGRLTLDTWKNNSPSFQEGGLWGDDVFPNVDSDWNQPGHSVTAQWTSSFGTGTVNQVTWSWSGNEIMVDRNPAGEGINKEMTSTIPEVFPGPDDRGHAVFWGDPMGNDLWTQSPWQNEMDLWVWKDDFSKVMGDHSFKAGFLYSQNSKNEDLNGNSPAYSPAFWTDGGRAIAGNGPGAGGWGQPNAPGRGGVVTGNGVADMLLKGTYWGGGTENSANARVEVRWKDYETYFADTWRLTPRVTLNYGMRWAYLPNPWDANGHIGSFVMQVYDPAKGATSDNGMIWPGNTKGVDVDSESLAQNHWFDFAPRLGLAWDPTGKGKWAIRLGGGMFFNREAVSDAMNLGANPPFVKTIVWGGGGRPFDSLPTDNTYSGGTGVAGAGKEIHAPTPGSYQWNLTIEREVWKDTKVEIGYVANRGHNLAGQINLNQVAVKDRTQFAIWNMDGIGDNDAARDQLRPLYPLKGTGGLTLSSRGFDSWYHSFQAYLVKRFSHGLSYQASYTYSKLLSTSFGLGHIGSTNLTDMFNVAYDKGLASFDRTHIYSGNVIYRTPNLEGQNGFLRTLLGAWETSIIMTANSGVPVTINCCSGYTGTNNNRPDVVADTKGPKTIDKWFNTAAFKPPDVVGRLGNSAPGQFRGPGLNNWDLSFMKNFPGIPWWNEEGATLQFRAELYNAFNHTQFQYVDSGFSLTDEDIDPATGKLTNWTMNNINFGRVNTIREPREIQLALKISW